MEFETGDFKSHFPSDRITYPDKDMMLEVVKIRESIKTLILEFVIGNGPGHVREIHLQVFIP